jgi:hypothetical protein
MEIFPIQSLKTWSGLAGVRGLELEERPSPGKQVTARVLTTTQAGKDMLDGLGLSLEQIGYQAGGRKIELFEGDTEGNSWATTRRRRSGTREWRPSPWTIPSDTSRSVASTASSRTVQKLWVPLWG